MTLFLKLKSLWGSQQQGRWNKNLVVLSRTVVTEVLMGRYHRLRNIHFVCVNKTLQFIQYTFHLAVDSYNIYKQLDHFQHLVYYQVLGEPGIAGCSRQSNIYLRVWICVHTYSLIIAMHVCFSHIKFFQLVSNVKLAKFSQSTNF